MVKIQFKYIVKSMLLMFGPIYKSTRTIRKRYFNIMFITYCFVDEVMSIQGMILIKVGHNMKSVSEPLSTAIGSA